MSHLPQVTGEELIRVLQRLGFHVHRKKGSYRFLKHKTDPNRFALVAVHKGETIPPGTLTKILRTAKVSVEKLKQYL